MRSWQMHEAREQLSEVLEQAVKQGPQEITWRGQSVAVVISRTIFDQLSMPQQSLVDFMRASPLMGREDVELASERGRSDQA